MTNKQALSVIMVSLVIMGILLGAILALVSQLDTTPCCCNQQLSQPTHVGNYGVCGMPRHGAYQGVLPEPSHIGVFLLGVTTIFWLRKRREGGKLSALITNH